MIIFKKFFVLFLKQFNYGSSIAVRLAKITNKSKLPIHPKHLLTQKPWFAKFINKTDVVLDLGCGNGQNSVKSAKSARKVIGVENDQKSLELANKYVRAKKISNVQFINKDLEKKLNFNHNSFDKILMLAILEHLRNRSQILEEVTRILKPQGKLFLSVPNSQTSWKKLQRSVGIDSFVDPDHKIEFSEYQIRKLLRKHKFKVDQLNYVAYDTPLRGLIDIIGGVSLPLYKKLSNWRDRKVKKNPQEAGGFEIIASKS